MEVRISLAYDGSAYPFDLFATKRVTVVDLRYASGEEVPTADWEAQPSENRIVWKKSGSSAPRHLEAVARYQRWTIPEIGELLALVGALAGLVVTVTTARGTADELQIAKDALEIKTGTLEETKRELEVMTTDRDVQETRANGAEQRIEGDKLLLGNLRSEVNAFEACCEGAK